MNCEQVDFEGLLSAYLDDQLTVSSRRRVTEHLTTCTECRSILDDYRYNDMLLAQLPRVEAPVILRASIFSSPRYQRIYQQHITGHPSQCITRNLVLTILATLVLTISAVIGIRLLQQNKDA